MGVPSSKPSSNEALHLCRDRTRFIKQAIDSRYALSAAHLSYIQSLKSIGTAFRKFIEAEILIEPSISTSEPDRTPSRSSYASNIGSPLSNVGYWRALAFTITPSDDFSWDFFDSTGEVVPLVDEDLKKSCKREEEKFGVDQSLEDLIGMASGELYKVNFEKEHVVAEREDASEFITHRAKDLVSSMKDIEYRFLRAAESGNEVSRLLETGKIRLNVATEIIGKSHPCQFLSTFHGVCCKAETILKHGSSQNLAKVITWNRLVSSLSSSVSSKYPFVTASRDGGNDSDCDFVEEFCMIAGSHSNTLDRLYAWERKLYDEVKACESIRKAYDWNCNQLRHQFARNFDAREIDKTRAVAKDLHSQMHVAIQAVDWISKKIEKMRDEELQPQLMELMQGLIRMWKAMLECHHTQFITISLAYHVMTSKSKPHNESFNQDIFHLQLEVDCFASSFLNFIKSHKSYIEAVNSWIHKCILLPQEQTKGRKKLFHPQRSLSLPPIFILCQNWSKGIKSLPYEELYDSIKGIVSILQELVNEEIEEAEAYKECGALGLDGFKTGLIRVFDRLAKFCEASLKAFEEVRLVKETARIE